jgi:23S rRNA (guanosine2251-2'-O)-methyltransferase
MTEVIFGRNAVREALLAGGRVRHLLVSKSAKQGPDLLELLDLARSEGVPLHFVDKERLDRLAEHHQGVVAEVKGYPYSDVDEILGEAAARREDPLILILDNVQDPQNFGTLLRTAEAIGVHGVIIPKRRSVEITPAVERASAGAVEHLRIARVPNLPAVIEDLKRRNIWVAAVETGGTLYSEANLTGPLALVLGSEGQGVGRLVRERCDFVVSLPMRGRVSSLNVAIAGSVVLYEVLRQRGLR